MGALQHVAAETFWPLWRWLVRHFKHITALHPWLCGQHHTGLVPLHCPRPFDSKLDLHLLGLLALHTLWFLFSFTDSSLLSSLVIVESLLQCEG